MQHDDDVGAYLEGGFITGFLVGAVAAVLGVDEDVVEVEGFGDGDGVVAAGVIYEDDFVNDGAVNFVDGLG